MPPPPSARKKNLSSWPFFVILKFLHLHDIEILDLDTVILIFWDKFSTFCIAKLMLYSTNDIIFAVVCWSRITSQKMDRGLALPTSHIYIVQGGWGWVVWLRKGCNFSINSVQVLCLYKLSPKLSIYSLFGKHALITSTPRKCYFLSMSNIFAQSFLSIISSQDSVHRFEL